MLKTLRCSEGTVNVTLNRQRCASRMMILNRSIYLLCLPPCRNQFAAAPLYSPAACCLWYCTALAKQTLVCMRISNCPAVQTYTVCLIVPTAEGAAAADHRRQCARTKFEYVPGCAQVQMVSCCPDAQLLAPAGPTSQAQESSTPVATQIANQFHQTLGIDDIEALRCI